MFENNIGCEMETYPLRFFLPCECSLGNTSKDSSCFKVNSLVNETIQVSRMFISERT